MRNAFAGLRHHHPKWLASSSSVIGNFVSLCFCHVRQPLHGGAQIVRRQVRVLARDRRAFVPHDIYSRKRRRAKRIRVRKAISKAISGVESGLCYASALCLAVRLELLGAKTSLQDSNCRFDTLDLKPLTKNQGKQNR